MRFSDAEKSAITAYCEQNGIAIPEVAADVKAMFMQALATPTPVLQSATPVEESEKYVELQSSYDALAERNKELSAQLGKVDENSAQHVEEMNAQYRRIAELEAQLQLLAAADENTVTIAFLPNVKRLLDIVCARLSERYARKYPEGVTPALLLADMFLRYNRDQYNDWFYPFVVSERDAKKILNGEEISEEE